MPFKSKAQRAYLYAKEPAVAQKFADHTSPQQERRLPEHVRKRKHATKEPKR